MFDRLLESSRWDDSNKRYNIGLTEERRVIEIKIRILSRAWPLPRLNFASSYGTADQYRMSKTYVRKSLQKGTGPY